MRTAYLECFAGISGDMFVGALIDAGVDPNIFHSAALAMNVDASIAIERVDRSGIASTKIHVLESGKLAEASLARPSFPEQVSTDDHTHRTQPKTQHLHRLGHAHTHSGEGAPQKGDRHSHGRSLSAIKRMIGEAPLAPAVRSTAILAFELLGQSEAKIHNTAVENIHFHEVGAVDAIVDIVGASAGIHALNADRWECSAINVGGGMVNCAHGRFPVPAPATADLLRGFPTYSADVESELVTPTGAALLRALFVEKGMTFGKQPAMRVEQIGYGAGTRNPVDFPNVLRLSVGNQSDLGMGLASIKSDVQADSMGVDLETVTVLETALDDLSPQVIAQVAESALERGALDVMLTPVIMKKGRPGTLITIICAPSESSIFGDLLLSETSTLGVRIRQDQRICLSREYKTVSTVFGKISIKVGKRGPEILNVNPEFEDCRRAALEHRVPVKQVQQAAIAAYFNDVHNA